MIKLKNDRIIIAGMTGSIAAGKSAVADIFKNLGATIIDADILSRKVVEPSQPAFAKVVREFGKEVVNKEGTLDRKALGNIVFNDAEARKKLEKILHPEIRKLFIEYLEEAKRNLPKNSPIIYIAPVLFESNNKYPELQKIIVVSAEPEISIQRVMKRDNCSRELAEKKYYSQMPIAEKEKKADFVIYNNKGLEELKDQASRVYRDLTGDIL